MGKPAVRKGDKCTGHGSAKPRANDQGSPDVFINGKPAHRAGDHWTKHKGHDSKLAKGSSSVFVNGKGQGRVGDPVLCGSRCAQGSPNVMVGSSSGSSSSASAAGPSAAPVDFSNPFRFQGGAGASGYSGSGSVEGEPGVDGSADDADAVEDMDQGPLDSSDDDIDWLTTCMIDEAGNQSTKDAWAAVAQVVVNRLRTGKSTGEINPAWRGTLKGIILANGQFSGFYFEMINNRYTRVVKSRNWAGAEARGKRKMAKYRTRSQWAAYRAVAQQVVNGSYTGGSRWSLVKNRPALLYCNLSISRPNWGTQNRFIAKIEDHSFFRA